MTKQVIPVEVSVPTDDPAEVQSLRSLVKRAEHGDRQALAEVREKFDAVPAAWEPFGNIAAHAQRAWIRLSAGSNPLVDEAIRRTSDRLREDLLGDASSPLERLLVDRVVACWVQLHFADQQAVAAMEAHDSIARCEYWQRQQDRAHRRYLSAIRTLAQVRRLLTPAVQVNIAEQQLNVMR